MAAPILTVSDLAIQFKLSQGWVTAVDGVDFELRRGEVVGIVGESGSGKSQILLAVMGLLAANGRSTGSALFQGREILNRSGRELDAVRGSAMAMIFQDPMTSLNPYMRVSDQLTEVLTAHRGVGRAEALDIAVRMLERVRIPEARRRIRLYPHEFSGGMRQRVMIAMALLCEPALLFADEPTTALDVTVQAQILELLADLASDLNAAIAIVTHDLGVIARLCDRVIVLYGGRIMSCMAAPTAIPRARPSGSSISRASATKRSWPLPIPTGYRPPGLPTVRSWWSCTRRATARASASGA